MDKIYILFFCVLLFSCKKNSSKFGNLNQNDIEIYNLVLNEQIGTENQVRNILKFYKNLSMSSFDDTIKKERDFLKKLDNNIDTCNLHVLISESIKFSNKDFDISTYITKQSFDDNLNNVPIEYFDIIEKLNNSKQKKEIDVEIFSNKNFYIIDKASQISKIKNEECIIGLIGFSNLVYDTNNSLACLYGQLICGGECGSGELFFLKFENDKWTVIARKTLWIS